MVLECVMLCLDNSDYMRNADYAPSRLDVQTEAASYIATMKMQANQETSVGVMAMAGSRAELLLSPTTDLGHVLAAIQNLRVKGTIALSTALRTSQLALSHRLNKHQKQRIIAFTGSPITENAKDLVKLGKLLRKNNVAVDVISFGEENTENENMEKLDQFIKTVNSNDNSRMVPVPPGPHSFVDMIVTTIFSDMSPDAIAAMSAGGIGSMGGDFDPDMELAIRMSLAEQRETQQASKPEGSSEAMMAVDDMDEEMARAIAMSMEQDVEMAEAPAVAIVEPSATASEASKAAPPSGEAVAEALNDPQFLDELLSELQVDKDAVDVDSILKSLGEEEKKDKDSKDNSSAKK